MIDIISFIKQYVRKHSIVSSLITKIKNINFASSQEWQDTKPNTAGTNGFIVKNEISMPEKNIDYK